MTISAQSIGRSLSAGTRRVIGAVLRHRYIRGAVDRGVRGLSRRGFGAESSADPSGNELNARDLFPGLMVEAGPFRGMVYQSATACGSSLLPKLAGVYESELHDVLKRLSDRDYKTVVDVGCAEGYYAVGLARMMPEAHVYAFDIDRRRIEYAKANALHNRVLERTHYGHYADVTTISDLIETSSGQSLVIVDIEGAEAPLFDGYDWGRHCKADYIVEVHPGLGLAAALKMASAFLEQPGAFYVEATSDFSRIIASRIMCSRQVARPAEVWVEGRVHSSGWLVLMRPPS